MLGVLGCGADPFGYYKQASFVPERFVWCIMKIKKSKIKEVYSWYA